MSSVLFCLRFFVLFSQLFPIWTLTTKEACIVDLADTELSSIATSSNSMYLGKQTSMETCSNSCFDINYLCDKQIADTLLYNKANRWTFINDDCVIQSSSMQNDQGTWILITDDILSPVYSIELQLSFPADVSGIGNAGITFKAQDVHHTNYFVGLQPKSHDFIVGRYEEWQWNQDTDSYTNDWETVYTIRVDVDNDIFYTYLDDISIGRVNGYTFDSTVYAQSYIGLMTWRTGPVSYRSLKIKYPDNTTNGAIDPVPICKAYTMNELDNKCTAYFVDEYMDDFGFGTASNVDIDSAVVYYKNVSSETCNEYLIRNSLIPTMAPTLPPTTLEPTAPSAAPSFVPTVNPTDIVTKPSGIDIDINIDIKLVNNTNRTDEDITIFIEDTIEDLLSDKLDIDGDDIHISIINKTDSGYLIQATIATKGGGLSVDYINEYLEEEFVDDLKNNLNDDEDITDITISVGNTPKTTMDDKISDDEDSKNGEYYIVIIICSIFAVLCIVVGIYFVFDKHTKKRKIAEQYAEGTHFSIASMSDLSNKDKGDTNNINLNLSAPYSAYSTPKIEPVDSADNDMMILNGSTITPQSPSDDNEGFNGIDTGKMNVNEDDDDNNVGIDGMKETEEENDDLYDYPGAHQTAGAPEPEQDFVAEPEVITMDGLPQIPPEMDDNDDNDDGDDGDDGNDDNEDSDDIYSEAPASPITPKYIE